MGNYYGTEYYRQRKSRMIMGMLVSIAMIGFAVYESRQLKATIAIELSAIGVFGAWFVLALWSYVHYSRKIRKLEEGDEG